MLQGHTILDQTYGSVASLSCTYVHVCAMLEMSDAAEWGGGPP